MPARLRSLVLMRALVSQRLFGARACPPGISIAITTPRPEWTNWSPAFCRSRCHRSQHRLLCCLLPLRLRRRPLTREQLKATAPPHLPERQRPLGPTRLRLLPPERSRTELRLLRPQRRRPEPSQIVHDATIGDPKSIRLHSSAGSFLDSFRRFAYNSVRFEKSRNDS
jgi:hypothetical protein